MNNYQFAVREQEIFTDNLENFHRDIAIPKRKVIIREDNNNILGVVSSKYGLLKHEDVINAFEQALVGIEHQRMIKLNESGSSMFATFKLDNIKGEVEKGDFVSLQFVVKNSYDGSNALQVILGAFRLVCSNGLIVGKQLFTYSQRHIGSGSEIQITILKEKINFLIAQFHNTIPLLSQMTEKKIDSNLIGMFDNKIILLPKYLLLKAKEQYDKEEKKTVWTYYNSLTQAITHNMKKESPSMILEYGKIAWKTANKLI